MTVSEDMLATDSPAVRAWALNVQALERDLDAERARCMDLADSLDRARTELRAAEAARDEARALAAEHEDACEDAKRRNGIALDNKIHWMAGMAVVHFFDLVFIEDLKRQLFGKFLTVEEARLAGEMSIYGRYMPKLRAFHRRAQAAESRAIKAERRADKARNQCCGKCDYARGLERAEKAEADYRAIAEALGIMYEGDGCASAPGPVDARVDAIRDLQRYRDKALEAMDESDLMDLGQARQTERYERERAADTRTGEATREWAVGDACEVRVDVGYLPGKVAGVSFGNDGDIIVETDDGIVRASKRDLRRPIPPTALEPSDGGNRQAEAITEEDCDLEDRARRMVTERAEVSESSERALAAKNLRISHLEARESALAECAELLGVLYPERWFNVPERARRTIVDRDKALAAIADRDARIADLERRLREAEGQRDALRAIVGPHEFTYAAVKDRAERAEERLRRVRNVLTGVAPYVMNTLHRTAVLAIIDEESGR